MRHKNVNNREGDTEMKKKNSNIKISQMKREKKLVEGKNNIKK